MEVVLVAYSHGGLVMGEWLAESLRHHHSQANSVQSIAQQPGEQEARVVARAFADSDIVIAILGPGADKALMFDYGVAVQLEKPFVLLAPDVESLQPFPLSLREGAQFLAATLDETAMRVLGSLQAA